MVKTRIQFKTDTVSNWENIETSFEGLPGEILVYSDYEDTGRVNHLGNKIYSPNIKIGKENKKLVSLPFLNNEAISNNQIEVLFNTSTSTAPTLDSLILDYAVLA